MFWTRLKMCWRNLGKNARRSTFTILAIAISFSAMGLFGGFVDYIYLSLKNMRIYAFSEGHLTVFHEAKGRPDIPLEKRTLSADLHRQVVEILESRPEVLIHTARMPFSGILSNGDFSTTVFGDGREVEKSHAIRAEVRGMLGNLKYFDGEPMSDETPEAIGVTEGLLHNLNIKMGDSVLLAGPTLDGQFNAVDCRVVQTFVMTGDMADHVVALPLKQVFNLLDSDHVEKICVLLKVPADPDGMKATLQARFAAKGLPVTVKTWLEQAEFYRRVRDMFQVIFLFLFIIVSLISLTIVINTISMAVLERTQEIGTLRAMGLKPRGVLGLFAMESFLLALVGVSFGLFLTISGWGFMKVIDLTWTPPQINVKIPLDILLSPHRLIPVGLGLIVLTVLAAVLAAGKAARMSIVKALRHA